MELNGASSPGAPAAWANAFCISTSGYLALEGPANALTKQQHSESSGVRFQTPSLMGSPCSWGSCQEGSTWLRPVSHLPSHRWVGFCPALLCMLTSGYSNGAPIPVGGLTHKGPSQVIVRTYRVARPHGEHTNTELQLQLDIGFALAKQTRTPRSVSHTTPLLQRLILYLPWKQYKILKGINSQQLDVTRTICFSFFPQQTWEISVSFLSETWTCKTLCCCTFP